jgi:hypothetical protein
VTDLPPVEFTIPFTVRLPPAISDTLPPAVDDTFCAMPGMVVVTALSKLLIDGGVFVSGGNADGKFPLMN